MSMWNDKTEWSQFITFEIYVTDLVGTVRDDEEADIDVLDKFADYIKDEHKKQCDMDICEFGIDEDDNGTFYGCEISAGGEYRGKADNPTYVEWPVEEADMIWLLKEYNKKLEADGLHLEYRTLDVGEEEFEEEDED